jgi:LmbE family N-acetylglucosaminyl deacetylase
LAQLAVARPAVDIRSVIHGPTIFVSPHYDDVALSCGGTVARLAEEGAEPLVFTVFASEVVEQMVGGLAAIKHARWRLDDPDAVARQRRDEDAAASRVLGCRQRWLGFPDAIYRDRYPADAQLYGAIHPEEEALAAQIAAEIRGAPEWRSANTVFVPLGVGRHVDHQLCFEAGAVLAGQGERVFAYEDAPYSIHTPSGVTEYAPARRAPRKQVSACSSVPLCSSLPEGTPVVFWRWNKPGAQGRCFPCGRTHRARSLGDR